MNAVTHKMVVENDGAARNYLCTTLFLHSLSLTRVERDESSCTDVCSRGASCI